MRLLLITDRVPYPVISGAPLRTYSLLRRIAKKHEVWLAAFAGTDGQVDAVSHLHQLCRGIETAPAQSLGALSRPMDLLRYTLTGKPPDLRLYYSGELTEKIRALASRVDFDVVQIEHSHMALYLEALPQQVRGKSLLVFHDISSSKYDRLLRLEPKAARRVRLWVHSAMMGWWEPRYAQRFDHCVTVSDVDRRLLLAANSRLRISVIPNGVDTKVCQPLPERDSRPALVFVGNMDYRPNADAMLHFCSQVLPRVRRAVPQAEMWIVGINPHPEVRQLDGRGVHVTGRVDDLRPYYERSSVCVVPLRAGGGTRLKILEAMALGRPVVSTSIGCEGLDVVHGKHLIVADSADDFAQQTVRLLTDETLKKSIVAEARRLVTTRYDWDVIARKQMQIYRQMAE